MENILTDQFVQSYKNKTIPWGFNGLGYIVYKRTYARIKEDGSQEEWFETVARCINGAQKIGAKYTKEEAEKLYDLVFNLKCNFAGRMLWQLGTSTVDRFGANSLLNCFAGETEIITSQGTMKIKDTVGKIVLMTSHGKYVEAEVRSFGINQLYKINLTKKRSKKEIYCTANHRWFKKIHSDKNIECQTIDLKNGDRLASIYDQSIDWKVESIDKTNRLEEVYCAVVPETHSFALEGNILTGNCWGVSITELKAFEFLFENLMLGGGVGYSIRREDIHELPRVKENVKIICQDTKDADFIIPDSRQGWIKLLREVLNSFFVTGKGFTYSTILIRSSGEPIKGFGGTASGPKILTDGIVNICSVISAREGKKLRSIDVLDICNIIGGIVVSGNIRRSAEIALGDPDDYHYIRAKNWSLGNVPNWRSMSNNTLYIDDFTHISRDVWENGFITDDKTGFAKGEPYGFFNLPLSQKFGRTKDGPMKDCDLYPTNKDNCVVTNPCVAPETLIRTKDGNKIISSLENQETEIWNGKKWSKTTVRKTGENQKLIKIIFDEGSFIDCTENHKFYIDLNNWIIGSNKNKESDLIEVLAKDLKVGQLVRKISKELYITLIKVESIIDLNRYDDTYCVNEPLEHKAVFNGILTGQCGEISLASFEACNLSELYLNNINSEEEMFICAKLLYKTQKAICALPFLHEETNIIVHKNMRIGLGITGVCQSLDKLSWLDKCYKELRKFDKEWSKKNDLNPSIKLSTVKPSGSLSLLAGATPGVHPAYSKYYIRRVRIAANDKLIKICENLGYNMEYVKGFDGKEDSTTKVVEFPCCSGENAILAKNMTAIAQLELVKKMQSEWADNAVSVTVYYQAEELNDIKKWLKENYEHNIKSVSFLLHSKHGFSQAPYEEITEDKYKELIKNIKPINTINDISGDVMQDLECVGGACPVR